MAFSHRLKRLTVVVITGIVLSAALPAEAQLVCLPSPRLLTTMPMGGQAGSTVEVTISGEYFENVGELRFSHKDITAMKKMGCGR